jgi:hypothetical protein
METTNTHPVPLSPLLFRLVSLELSEPAFIGCDIIDEAEQILPAGR